MKIVNSILLITAIILAPAECVRAQTPTDELMMEQWEICAGLIYEYSEFEEYWEGTKLRTHGAIATVKRNSMMPMASIGIMDRLNLIVSLPWIRTKSTEPNGGFLAGDEGFQDIGLNLKGEIYKKQLGPGKLTFLTNAGFAAPVSNYHSDYRPYSLGNGTTEFSLRGILNYRFDMGVYARGAVAYLWRGQTETERDYYYNNGSYYTAWMDVPDAWNYHATAGVWLFENSLRVEASYVGLKSTSGDDIRAYNAPQPTNKVNFDQMGLFAQYYFDIVKGLGVLAYYSQVFDGRNAGKSTTFGGGLTYQFHVKKQDSKPADKNY